MKKLFAALALLALLLPSIAFADVFAGPTTLSAPGTVVLGTGGSASVVVTATGSPTTPAFTIQGSSDDPTKVAVGAATWTSLVAVPVGGGAGVTSMSGTGKWTVGSAGMARVQVNLSALAAGSIIFTMEGGPGTSVVVPSSGSAAGVAPGASPSAEGSHVFTGAHNVSSVAATNLTSTSGFLVLLNAASAPADGAITPLACAPLSANGQASISYGGQPAGLYGTGIVAVLTSGANCFTKTTGVITGFISGIVQ